MSYNKFPMKIWFKCKPKLQAQPQPEEYYNDQTCFVSTTWWCFLNLYCTKKFMPSSSGRHSHSVYETIINLLSDVTNFSLIFIINLKTLQTICKKMYWEELIIWNSVLCMWWRGRNKHQNEFYISRLVQAPCAAVYNIMEIKRKFSNEISENQRNTSLCNNWAHTEIQN